MARRARIILESSDGNTDASIALRLGVTRETVGKWRRRFLIKRLEGLLDEPRPGAPRKITDADIRRVLSLTLESRPPDASHWTTRSMARAVGLSQSTVSRIWRAFALKPWKAAVAGRLGAAGPAVREMARTPEPLPSGLDEPIARAN